MKTSFPNEIAEYCIEGARAKVPNSVVQQYLILRDQKPDLGTYTYLAR